MEAKWLYNKEKHQVEEQPTWTEADFVKSLPVSGKVTWADGEDVTGKFTIGKSDDFVFPYDVAIPIQEQPQPDFYDYVGKIVGNQSQQQEVKAVGDAEIEKMYAFEVWKEKALAYVNNLQKTSQRYGHGNYIEDLLSYIQENVVYPLKIAALQPEAEGTTYSEWQLCPKCNGQGTYRTIGEYASTTAFIQCDVCFGAKVLAKNVSEQIVAYVHEIDSLRETNRKLGEKIAELQPEAVSASQLKQKQ